MIVIDHHGFRIGLGSFIIIQKMITEDTLRRDVLQYLRKNYSIKLQLPSLKRHLSDKINLKIFRSPLGDNLPDNRYKVLINLAEDLLRKNIINTEKIKQFGQCFFQTINQDIMVLQNNQEIRKNFTRIRDQITYRIEELTIEQKKIEEECKEINDKEDILIFLQGSFKTYLANVKVVSDHYDGINSAQVYTSININSIYSEKIAQEDDYLQHFQPLLEVMQRLKANMVKLYQQLNRCEYFELPLKSVNFLANCKNLLTELQPFLIKPDCVFNRLIFNVTKGQKENNRLISNVFQSNIAFTNDIVSDIFKSFFLGHIFKDYFVSITEKLEKEKKELMAVFEGRNTNLDSFSSHIYKSEKRLAEIAVQIDSLRKIIGIGKDKIMREYLGRKECKKGKRLNEVEQTANNIKKLSKTMHTFLKHKIKVQMLVERGKEVEDNVAATIFALKQLQEKNIRTHKPQNSNIKQLQSQIQKRIQDSYLNIQDTTISVQNMINTLKEAKEEESEVFFHESYFPKQFDVLEEVKDRMGQIEVGLLNSYQNLRKQKLHKAEQTLNTKSVIFEELNEYFDTKVSSQMGFEIRNQDKQCEQVKDNIVKVQKMEFMLTNYLSNQNKEELEQLLRFKANLQWLLQVFQGSMDEQIFQKFMLKLNFQVQDWKEQVSKVKELTKELQRYVGVMKSISRSPNISKINQKVFKLIKNRTQLYEILQDIYEEFTLIYQTCKEKANLNVSDHGLKLFDQPTYKYVLMLYQYKNRMRAELEELKDLLIPKKTINYLIDELYEPFIQVFEGFAAFSEEELLNFTLRLEHALNFKTSHVQMISLFQQTLGKPYFKGYFQSVTRICQEMMQLREDNNLVLDLQGEEVVTYNLPEFRERIEVIKEHIMLAESFLKERAGKNLTLDIQFSNKNLNVLRAKLLKQWGQHREQIEPSSVSHSRADDFSQHNQL